MLLLAIESSCDETAAAVLQDGVNLLSSVVDSQIQVHSPYGGIVPELASRRHIATIYPVVEQALQQAGVRLDQLDAIAATQGPGLVGSLLIGMSFAKAAAYVENLPCIGVDHMAGHLLSIFLGKDTPSFPYIALIASGGHSSIYIVHDHLSYEQIGQTRDDAAGEAFDKVAKLLGLGYPGGPVIAEKAEKGKREAISFPRAWLEADSFDFSFSGVKTAVVNFVNRAKQKNEELNIPDICASFQEAVADVLVEKTIMAARKFGIDRIVLAGGVGANQRLREHLTFRALEEDMGVFLPPKHFCTDNAAMIAIAGYHLFNSGRYEADSIEMDVYSRSPVGI
ncbi:MAG: tRNA (adenosine(37)-N6)-threonylcarbamoyltransferase complex transferase subunit TsaD [Deltaproteobacteria bacterium]|jgi:N6-L-threonylcarbamoyladenine synthase|nr:tRNA (adenosine(37)-N6)-threonylcarbamoyltransferase complex transferase subunit TsaD [Deltaproteobacteria bacterium]